MTAALLLDRLEGVQPRGEGRWMARCPSHEDRQRSLSIREISDGTILLKCFAGCGAADVTGAIGLTLADLFPEKPEHHKPAIRDYRHVHAAREALQILATESLLVAIAAENLAAGRELTDDDRERLHDAAIRIRAVREVAA